MFNCRAQIIVPSGPIEIVPQRDPSVVDEATNIAFYTMVLRLSIFQLSQCNLVEVLLEG